MRNRIGLDSLIVKLGSLDVTLSTPERRDNRRQTTRREMRWFLIILSSARAGALPWPVGPENKLWVVEESNSRGIHGRARKKLRTALFAVNATPPASSTGYLEDARRTCAAFDDVIDDLGLNGMMSAYVSSSSTGGVVEKRWTPAAQAEDTFFTGRHILGTWVWALASRAKKKKETVLREAMAVAASDPFLRTNALGSAVLHGILWTDLLIKAVEKNAGSLNATKLWARGTDLCAFDDEKHRYRSKASMECLHGIGHGIGLASLSREFRDLKKWTPCDLFAFNRPTVLLQNALELDEVTIDRAVDMCHDAAPTPQLAFAAGVGLFHEFKHMVPALCNKTTTKKRPWHWPCGSITALSSACFIFGAPTQHETFFQRHMLDFSTFRSERNVRGYYFGRGHHFGREALVSHRLYPSADEDRLIAGEWAYKSEAAPTLAAACAELARGSSRLHFENRWLSCAAGVGFAFFYTMTYVFDLSPEDISTACSPFANVSLFSQNDHLTRATALEAAAICTESATYRRTATLEAAMAALPAFIAH